MKRWIISLVLCLCVCLLVGELISRAEAADVIASGSCGDSVKWTLDSDGVLTIRGSGKMHNYSDYNRVPWDSQRESIHSVVIEQGVTSIGSWAFFDCSSLTSITIPEGVTSIGDYAFSGCSSLTSITIPNCVTSIGSDAFYECSGLASVKIGNGVESIGHAAFTGCSSLTDITIPESVTSIGDLAFVRCTGLTSIHYNAKSASLRPFDSGIFNYAGSASGGIEVIFGDSVETIPAHLFFSAYYPSYPDCHAFIKSITIGSNVTSIEEYALSDCPDLTNITIPNSVTSIGDHAFYHCSGLTSITIPDSVTSIGDYTFYNCADLTSVTIGKGVTSIGKNAFFRCTRIWVDANNTAYSNDENGTLYNKNKTKLIRCPSGFSGAYVIPESVTSIGDYAFSGCTSLTSITIPNGVTSIGDDAFFRCSSLTSITIPEGVTSIGDRAFSGCSGLTSIRYNANAVSIGSGIFGSAGSSSEEVEVVIGNAVEAIPANLFKSDDSSVPIKSITFGSGIKSIAASSFAGCSGIGSIFFTGNAPTIGDNAFGGVDAVAFYPAESATWVSKKSDYGGTLYWVPYDPEKEIVASGICGENIVWQLDRNGVLNVKGSGEFAGVSLWSQFRPMISEIVFSDAITMTEIPASAFLNYTRLTAITLPSGIERIGGFSFSNCTALTSITIPDSVTSIGSSAFSGCTALKAVAFLGKKPSVASDAFLNVTAVAYYPENLVNDTSWPQGGSLDGYGGRLTWRPWYTLGNDLLCEHVLTDTVVAPSCSWGYTLHKCACGYSYRSDFEPGSGHDWGDPVYDWADDHSAITATRVCKRDPDHAETENGVVTSTVTKEATYDAEGEITYTATFANPAFEPQTAVVSLPRLERPTPTPAENPFTDIRESAYYHDPVLWAVANNVTNGTSAATFSPDEGCTRAQVVTFLWRAAGKPDPASSKSPFSDVKEGAYYYNAVLWAVEKGITNGTSDKTFSPDETCTRAQIVTFLWRYEEQPASAGTSNPFADVKPNAYFGSAVLWAVETGITNGTSATTFDPEDTCTRAQVVTFLYRDIVKS